MYSTIRHAIRRLLRERSLTIAAVLTLALGIGATTAVFTVVNAVLLQPLAYPRPERLADLSHTLAISGITRVDQSDATFLYSVFDVGDSDPGFIIYRGRLEGEVAALPPELRFFPADELPFDAIPVREVRSMLRRYLRERGAARFGIYIDSADGGRVAMIDGDARPWQPADAGTP